jgi:membrane carboxypeptidase/penicillin-binding protein
MSALKSFLKRHKIATAAVLLLLLFPLLYFSLTAIKAYRDTPRIISEIESSGKLRLKVEDVPDAYLQALLRVEDPNFYTHNGIDLTTPGAGWTTITQGLVKVYFYNGFSPGFLRYRKIDQTLIAWIFNRQVEKKKQLQIFINAVYLGEYNGTEVIGFEEGARAYFNKEFSMLSEDEFLSLVAMIVGPNDYNAAAQPAKNQERVRRIRKLLRGECQPAGLGDVFYEQCG